ncbi:hypothetical protein D7B24_009401 [Verticillium nonalfalfae]|uniref:Uncharacterized protein n=1 Tax=Verticillium nonalfalfae TaxID=1051616 RepID=A0A3M9Y3S0_9PEZI|nr:uncharacterized protein D7B24_009401 [Verticillium nonalfalfae]RNJ54785.1 hypothetical protein D7B24_009401 [Verticillium nonalfalfae]
MDPPPPPPSTLPLSFEHQVSLITSPQPRFRFRFRSRATEDSRQSTCPSSLLAMAMAMGTEQGKTWQPGAPLGPTFARGLDLQLLLLTKEGLLRPAEIDIDTTVVDIITVNVCPCVTRLAEAISDLISRFALLAIMKISKAWMLGGRRYDATLAIDQFYSMDFDMGFVYNQTAKA